MKRFITFEGIDGSGKSTVSKKVYKHIESMGYDVVLTFEPTDSYIGRIVKECIENDVDPFVTAFAFIADRIDHCKKIQEWLDRGKIVLCDRYAESTYAYQGVQMQDMIDDPVKWLQDLSKNRILTPDRTFVFLIKPEASLARIQNRDKLIPFERLSFLEKVHEFYVKIAVGERFKILDATKPVDELVNICVKDIL
ncbi:MAG: dTMP kinase [Thermoplasmata archaeon]|nr:MAG: dTMP kinase [Thermoplasmata archaeon]